MAERVVLQSASGAEIKINGRSYLYFGGTNYLAMSGRKEVAEGACQAIAKYGMSSSASRTTTGTNELHLRLESAIARFTGTEAAAVLSSGYQSMRALLEAISETDDLILFQKGAHQSIADAAKLSGLKVIVFSVDDPNQWDRAVEKAGRTGRRVLVVGEGVGPLTGRIFPLPEMLGKMAGIEYKILLDDAHGFGVLGEHARGVAEHYGIESAEVLTCGTLSKALGSFGGCVFGSEKLIGNLRARGKSFICASQPSAADMGAALAALDFLEKNPQLISNLRENTSRVREGLRKLGIEAEDTPVPVIPILKVEGMELTDISDRLFERGFLAPYLNYPGSPAGGMIRLAVCADHSREQVDGFLDNLAAVLKER